MNEVEAVSKTRMFFTAVLEEYKIRLEAVEKNRAQALGILPVLALTALAFGWYFFVEVLGNSGSGITVGAIVACVAEACFVAGMVFLLMTASRKGFLRADVNALLKAARQDDSQASEAMANHYIDRINDLDHLLVTQQHHFRSGTWLMFAYGTVAVLSFVLQGIFR
jgi:hypothetical protein